MILYPLIDRLTQLCRAENDEAWECYFCYKGFCHHPNPILDLDDEEYLTCFSFEHWYVSQYPGVEEIERGNLRMKKIIWEL